MSVNDNTSTMPSPMDEDDAVIIINAEESEVAVPVVKAKKPRAPRAKKEKKPEIKVPKLTKKPKSKKKQLAMKDNLKMTAWNVALRNHGWFSKSDASKSTDEKSTFTPIPKKGTPEHAALKETQEKLIIEWQALGGVPEEHKKKSIPTTDSDATDDCVDEVRPRKRKPSKRTRTLAYAAALRKLGYLKDNNSADYPKTIKHKKLATRLKETYLSHWIFKGGVFPDDAITGSIPKTKAGFEFTEDGVISRPIRKRAPKKKEEVTDQNGNVCIGTCAGETGSTNILIGNPNTPDAMIVDA